LTISMLLWIGRLLLGVAQTHGQSATLILLCLLCMVIVSLLAILFFRFYYIKIGRKNPSIDEILASCKKIDPPKDT
jgi:hypothetical protein